MSGAGARRPIVLVVDGNDETRNITLAVLGHHAYDTLQARTSGEALELAREHRPDLVLTEITLRLEDGWRLCSRLRADRRTAHIPVCFLTAITTTLARERSRAAGADCFLRKPYRVRELVEWVSGVLVDRTPGAGPGA